MSYDERRSELPDPEHPEAPRPFTADDWLASQTPETLAAWQAIGSAAFRITYEYEDR